MTSRLGRQLQRDLKDRGASGKTPGPAPSANGPAKRQHPPVSAQADPEPPPTVKTIAADALVNLELPEPRLVVPQILPEGLGILAGKPKLGKSWAALNIALAVADGGIALSCWEVAQGDVLYLALEDNQRRLKDRLCKLLKSTDTQAPPRLTFATEWPRQDQGGWLALKEWLIGHPEARLLIIDTWAKYRPAKQRGKDDYEQDYQHAGDLKALADHHGVAILILHHCRKLEASDPIDSVSGTLGLTGAADAVMVLKRERGQHDAALFVSGRDIEEQELALKFDPAYCLWMVQGSADEFRLTKERAEVLAILRKNELPMSPAELAPLLRKSRPATKMLCWRMSNDGYLMPMEGGKYMVS
jgi:hypothetical protein